LGNWRTTAKFENPSHRSLESSTLRLFTMKLKLKLQLKLKLKLHELKIAV